ncbi:hypothetical protein Zm00014a_016451 [Zea mays]|uniref:Uncharacterized protein n=1 Tax=Zea mays TaxID=4577 RepID=A0A3L6D8J9_MAIZE|nr:hypothetical protein Zm00014a_016451 [Zea mays]
MDTLGAGCGGPSASSAARIPSPTPPPTASRWRHPRGDADARSSGLVGDGRPSAFHWGISSLRAMVLAFSTMPRCWARNKRGGEERRLSLAAPLWLGCPETRGRGEVGGAEEEVGGEIGSGFLYL